MITYTAPTDVYLLPEDGKAAKTCVLNLIANAQEIWGGHFGFDDVDIFAELESAATHGVPIHLCLDHTQFCGNVEKPAVTALAAKLAVGEIVITTAGAPSAKVDEIFHVKTWVFLIGGTHTFVHGSYNFTGSGPYEANTMAVTQCDELCAAYLAWWTAHREWALAHQAHLQIGPVTA